MSAGNGCQAFPDGITGRGMTLRDYFAAKAMQALICSPFATQEWIAEFAAPSAYQMADKMLVERAK